MTTNIECPICYETVFKTKRIILPCGHTFCCECTIEWLNTCNEESKNMTCPMCRKSFSTLKTPDEKQFQEISGLLEFFKDQIERKAFMYHHFHT